jgi:hypothetical protein
MIRDFRGARYEIEISKPDGVCKGEVQIELDGEVLADNLIPPQHDGKTHRVKATVTP